jgi:hypothetical protein
MEKEELKLDLLIRESQERLKQITENPTNTRYPLSADAITFLSVCHVQCLVYPECV